jgi:hypothetical protein
MLFALIMLCTCCFEEKPEDCFYLHSNGQLRKQCKKCHYARSKQWVSNNREELNKKARDSYETRKEVALAATNKWRKNNLAYDAFRTSLYRARKLQASPKWANLKRIEDIYQACPKGFHVDHVVPLKGINVCGLHVENNLQYLPACENIRKKNHYA